MEILSFASLDSTNAYALELAASGAAPETVVWALEQTAGRGQYDRTFSSPKGGLYFSLLLQPALEPQRLPLVTLGAGVGCCLCLENQCALSSLLKWPNDLYVQGRKLGGILTQTLPLDRKGGPIVVIGIGLNVNSIPEDFSPELSPTVTSVLALTGKRYDLKPLLEALVSSVLCHVQSLEHGQEKLLAQWDQRDYLKGQCVEWHNGPSTLLGIGQGILCDGRYSLCDRSGTVHSVVAGTLIASFTPDSAL